MLGINRAYPFWLEFEGSTWFGIPRADGIVGTPPSPVYLHEEMRLPVVICLVHDARDLAQALQDVGGVSLGCDLCAL